MYRGYNLLMPEDHFFDSFYAVGRKSFDQRKSALEDTLGGSIRDDGSLEGSKLREAWFPKVYSDVFISHSHQDEPLAIKLAGFLEEHLGLTAFVDSCVWSYADKLLKLIDNDYCREDKAKETYDYTLRNCSTAHVHAMLSTAITAMMDNSECLFFLNTPKSTHGGTPGKISETNSPWIFYEIEISGVIRRNKPTRYRRMDESALTNLSKTASYNKLKISYDVNLSHLAPISKDDLIGWAKKIRAPQRGAPVLDTLYDLFPEPRQP